MQLGLSIWDFVRNIIWWLLGTLTQEVNPFRATSTFSVIASSAGLEKVSAKIGKDQFFKLWHTTAVVEAEPAN